MNLKLLRLETTLYFRDVAAVVFGLLLTPIILIILGSVPAFRLPDPALGGRTVIDLYVPIMLTLAIAMVAISTMPAQLAAYRERGILRRLSTTPVRPRDLLVAHAAAQFLVLLLGSVIVVGLGATAFGVRLPANPAAFAIAFLLNCAAMFGLGVLIASFGSSKVAQGLGSAAFFPMMFFAGLWVPREAMPATLRTIGDFTPLGAGVQALQDASVGHWPHPLHIGVLLGYIVVVWLAAVRFFRWS